LKTQRDSAVLAGSELALAREQLAEKEQETLAKIEALEQELIIIEIMN